MNLTRLVSALSLAATTTSLAFASPTSATTVHQETFTCPIGGEVFEDYSISSYSTFGQRPDGRPYGTLEIMPLIECPSNGFPLFQEEFTDEEVARLTPLVNSDEFQAMRMTETSYYRLWWLRQRLARPEAELANALLVASWETDDDPARKVRYQQAFVAAAAAVPGESEDWFYYNLRAANALRELGKFDEASVLLQTIGASSLRPTGDDEREAVDYLIDGLVKLIAESNSHAEPTNLIPPEMAVERCESADADLSASEVAACASPEYVAVVARRHEYESEAAAEAINSDANATIDDLDATDVDAAMADAEANAEAVGDAADEFECHDEGDSTICSATVLIDEGD